MKVLLVYPYLPHPGVTHGSGRLLVPLLRRWRDLVEITLVCGFRPGERGHVEEARALVHGLHAVERPQRSDLSFPQRILESARTLRQEFRTGWPRFAVKLD